MAYLYTGVTDARGMRLGESNEAQARWDKVAGAHKHSNSEKGEAGMSLGN